MGKTEQVVGRLEDVKGGILELKKLYKYYRDEIKQNQTMLKTGRAVSIEEYQYFMGRAEAYADHMAETAYIIQMMEGKISEAQ